MSTDDDDSEQDDGRRHSQPIQLPPRRELSDLEKARKEVENGYAQADRLDELITQALEATGFRLRRSTIELLNRLAVEELVDHPGALRKVEMVISKSKHVPPPPHELSSLLDDFCDYINQEWHGRTAQHLGAYALWRLNWIHPFEDGNGRTSRAVAYLLLCVRSGRHFPGGKTLPERIMEKQGEYYRLLEVADETVRQERLDVSEIEEFIRELALNQVSDAMASAKPPPPIVRRLAEPLGSLGVVSPTAPSRTVSDVSKEELKKSPVQFAVKVLGGLAVAGILALFGRDCGSPTAAHTAPPDASPRTKPNEQDTASVNGGAKPRRPPRKPIAP
jgi:fido (protein-threonine AMPylation protein)